MENHEPKNSICFIVGAGDFDGMKYLPKEGDYIIAADGGYEYLKKLNIATDMVLGDFDSLGYEPNHANVIKHPVMKDDTDMLLAIKTAMDMGYVTFYIYGGLGGRLDHTMANVQALSYIADHGGCGYLIGIKEVVTVLRGRMVFDETFTGTISVFSTIDKSEHVSIQGLKYEVEDFTFYEYAPLGVSNEFIRQKATIDSGSGKLTILWENNEVNELPILI